MSHRREELLFEYDQLRKELLQRDAQLLQIRFAIIVFIGALYTVAFSSAVSSEGGKAALFLATFFFAFSGMWQMSEQSNAAYKVASYLRIVIEPSLPGVNWETRLYHTPGASSWKSLRFLSGPRISLSLCALISLILSLYFLWRGIDDALMRVAAVVVVLAIAATVILTWRARYNQFHIQRHAFNENIWRDVLTQEQSQSDAAPDHTGSESNVSAAY